MAKLNLTLSQTGDGSICYVGSPEEFLTVDMYEVKRSTKFQSLVKRNDSCNIMDKQVGKEYSTGKVGIYCTEISYCS